MNSLFGFGVSFALDGFKILYMAVSLFAWTMCLIFAPRYLGKEKHQGRFYVFSIITLIATLGVFAAGDLFTLFMFFEIMSFASYVWVAQEENEKALKAADTYMAVAVIGGLVLLMGILLLYTNVGTLDLASLKEACATGGKYGKGRLYAAAFCMFFGFSAKAGAFPIHIWLPKAHPVAPAPASALLSGVLTKTGIYGIMIVSFYIFEGDALWGCFVLAIGLTTMVLGALLALFSIDIKRTLACSSVSQIGFIIVGIAVSVLLSEEGKMARYGTLLHMVNHTFVKICVFLVAGVIYQNVHKLDLNAIRGFGKNKPFLAVSFALGALSLAGVPGFLGFLSKTGMHEALLEIGGVLGSKLLLKSVECLFLFSGGCTLCYMLKLFVCVFVEKNQDEKVMEKNSEDKPYMGMLQRAAVIIPSICVLALGIIISIKDEYTFYVLHVLKGSFISIAIGIFLYFAMVRLLLMDKKYLDMWPKWLDLEEKVYKPFFGTFSTHVLGFEMRILDNMIDSTVVFLRKTMYKDLPLKEKNYEGTIFTHLFGHTVDVVNAKLKHEEVKYDYEHKMALKSMERQENVSLAKRSLSFGLILACLGVFLMLFFILYIVYLR